MKVKLVYPKIEEAVSFELANKIMGIKISAIPLAVPTLAALTPNKFEVLIEDENLKPLG